MKRAVHTPIPTKRALRKLGKDMRDARRVRRIPIKLMAERTGLSPATIGKIERGEPTTSMGGYATVLFVLGLTDRLHDLADARHDLVGLRLQEEKLPQRVRLPRRHSA